MKFSVAEPLNHKNFKWETSSSIYIPYKCFWDANTILLKDDSLLRVIKVRGFSFETADDEEIDMKKEFRNNLFKSMTSGNLGLYFHTIRRTKKAFPEGEMSNMFTKKLNEEWKNRHNDDRSFVNELYISVIRKDDKAGIAKLATFAKNVRNKADERAKIKNMKENFLEIEEVTSRILNSLSSYNAELLGVLEAEDGIFSEICNFLGTIINCEHHQNYRFTPYKLSSYLPTNKLFFGKKNFEVRFPFETRYGGMISLKEYRNITAAGMLDSFLQLPFEFIMTQSFQYINRTVAIGSIQLQQRRMIQVEDVAVSQIQEIDQALDETMSGKFSFGKHHLTLMCIADTKKSLDNNISMAVVEFSNSGITAVREGINTEATFWGQLPGNFAYIVRKATINSLNLASFASLHNYPSGEIARNHWGPAVSVLNTVSGTPFFFNFHVRDVGHTMIIGPTGSGKTVTMNFLCAQAQKFNCRMFFFDKDRGAEIFIRAIEGKYIPISRAKNSNFNPLTLPETPDNKSFLVEWLRALVSTNGENITATDMARINEAVVGNYKLPPEKRILRNIAPFFGMSGPDTLAGRLEMWHSDGSHAKFFDNQTDNIDFFSSRAFAFDMTEILRDQVSIGPVLLYLFHRINESLDGTPTMIILDEAWALIDNPVFAPKLKDWLKVLRKLNAFVIFATQSVEDATKSSISDTLVQQTATQIYLPNIRATKAYQEIFMLSDRELSIVKTIDPGSRFFLIKQDNSGVVAKVDLSGMDDVISVLSGRAETVILMDEIMKEINSTKPEDWLPIFYKRVRRV